jgi:hypothetical protein
MLYHQTDSGPKYGFFANYLLAARPSVLKGIAARNQGHRIRAQGVYEVAGHANAKNVKSFGKGQVSRT